VSFFYRLTIPGTLPTFNELLDERLALSIGAGVCGRRPNRYSTNKGELQERLVLVWSTFRMANSIDTPLRGPLTVSMIWRGRGRVDFDNLAAGAIKVLIDAAVAAKVLHDDTQRTVVGWFNYYDPRALEPSVDIAIQEGRILP